MKKNSILLLLLVFLGCNSGGGGDGRSTGQISFADQALEEIIREQVGKPSAPLTIEDLLSIEVLDLKDSLVASLLGLNALKNLIYLDIRDTQITNLAVLAKMPQLETLKFRNKNSIEIENISMLSSLTNLKELEIWGRHDFSFLADLPQLETLTVYATCSSDDTQRCIDLAETLQNFTSLKYLSLRNNFFQDISFLSQLTGLEFLDLSWNDLGLDDLSPLADLKNLKELVIINSFVYDISPLSELPVLEDVDLSWNCISDFTPVANVATVIGVDNQNECPAM